MLRTAVVSCSCRDDQSLVLPTSVSTTDLYRLMQNTAVRSASFGSPIRAPFPFPHQSVSKIVKIDKDLIMHQVGKRLRFRKGLDGTDTHSDRRYPGRLHPYRTTSIPSPQQLSRRFYVFRLQARIRHLVALAYV